MVQYLSFPSPRGKKFTCQFLLARNYLTKVGASIPKMELDAAYLNCLLAQSTLKSLGDNVESVHLFVDSSVTLWWISSEDLTFSVFHRSRVAEIRESFGPNVLHVPTHLNPAETGTREGVIAEDICPLSMFFNGPEWLAMGLQFAVCIDTVC